MRASGIWRFWGAIGFRTIGWMGYEIEPECFVWARFIIMHFLWKGFIYGLDLVSQMSFRR